MSETVYIGIGSNLSDPKAMVVAAIESIDASEHCEVVSRSSLYATAPMGFSDQPDYINAACALKTDLTPDQMLDFLLATELKFGRKRTGLANRPRTIDLDLLLYGQRAISKPNLQIPHPRMHERCFVLAPLAQIDINIIVPGHGRVGDLLASTGDQRVEVVS